MKGQPKRIGNEWIIMIYKKTAEDEDTLEIRSYPYSEGDKEIPFTDEIPRFKSEYDALREMRLKDIQIISNEEIRDGSI